MKRDTIGSTEKLVNKLKQVITRIQPSVVQIKMSASIPGKPDIKSAIAGTGFFVAQEQFIATAAHVIADTQQELQRLQATGVSFNVQIPLKDVEIPGKVKMLPGFVETPFPLISIDQKYDLAILKTGARLGRHGVELGCKSRAAHSTNTWTCFRFHNQ